ncbi:MAG: ABC-2 family transporter protein [Oscillospiraceae bacterium]|jgi:ABC-2 type transport system permease protein|nr:ABC-2 family transporter protein [Oscillospiraceae bacterium]
MTKYLSLFKIRFLTGLQYRAAALAGLATQFAWGGFYILFYKALNEANPAALPMEMGQLASYVWLNQAFIMMYATWFWDKEIADAISSGSVAYELTRPTDVYAMWFFKDMGNRTSRAMLRAWPILLFAVLLPAPYGFSAPDDWRIVPAFLISMLLAFVITVSFSMLMYVSTFYTVSPLGVRVFLTAASEFLAGQLIPLPFFPQAWQKAVALLPFASMNNAPFRIYSGHIAGRELWLTLALQCFWAVAMIALGRAMMGRATRKLIIQGG